MMIINHTNYPSIGLIRVKDRPDGKYMLELHPPQGQTQLPIATNDACQWVDLVEVVVTAAELRRIRSVAPHLVAMPVHPAQRPTGVAQGTRR